MPKSKRFAPTNIYGTCLWCGVKLIYVTHVKRKNEVDPKKPPRQCHCGCERFNCDEPTEKWYCTDCGFGHDGRVTKRIVSREIIFDKPGAYGDGYFCTMSCAQAFAISAAERGRGCARKENRSAPQHSPR